MVKTSDLSEIHDTSTGRSQAYGNVNEIFFPCFRSGYIYNTGPLLSNKCSLLCVEIIFRLQHYGPKNCGKGVGFLAGGRNFSLHHCIQTD
jgi:hypothetical protein